MLRRKRPGTTLESLFEYDDIFVVVMKQLTVKDVKSRMDLSKRARYSPFNQTFIFGHFRRTKMTTAEENATLRNFYLNIDLSYQVGFADAPVVFLKMAVTQKEKCTDANRDDLIYRRPELF